MKTAGVGRLVSALFLALLVLRPVPLAQAAPVGVAAPVVPPIPGPDGATATSEPGGVPSSLRSFFDPQVARTWQYMKPHILLQTGFIYEQFDETNVVFRQAGMKLWHAQLGFKGALDEHRLGSDWRLAVRYVFTGDFAGSVSASDAYGEVEVRREVFGVRLRIGVAKVPFLASELQSDGGLSFIDRPQFVAPYGSRYLTDMVRIGLKRHAGVGLRLAFFDEALTVEGGAYSGLGKPREELWETTVFAVRANLSTLDWIHDRVRIEAGGGFYDQKKLPLILENSRYAFCGDASVHAFGAFVGGEWAMQIMDDAFRAADYERFGYKNYITRAMGYQAFAGYSSARREYEAVFRYQWWDPDDTNINKPIPQSANQALRWLTVAFSWWPVDLVRVMVQYTHKFELEAASTSEFTEERLKDVSNDEVLFQLQVSI